MPDRPQEAPEPATHLDGPVAPPNIEAAAQSMSAADIVAASVAPAVGDETQQLIAMLEQRLAAVETQLAEHAARWLAAFGGKV